MLTVPGTKIAYRRSDKGGLETTWGEGWHFTFRSEYDVRAMHPTIEGTLESIEDDDESLERELFGETLDDPIPDDLWEMLSQL